MVLIYCTVLISFAFSSSSLKYSQQGIKVPQPRLKRTIEKIPKPGDDVSRDGMRGTFGHHMLIEYGKSLPFTYFIRAFRTDVPFIGQYKFEPSFFPWADWLKIAMKYKICITNWPLMIKAPGEGYDLKKVTHTELRLLEKSGVKIVRWTDGMQCPFSCSFLLTHF